MQQTVLTVTDALDVYFDIKAADMQKKCQKVHDENQRTQNIKTAVSHLEATAQALGKTEVTEHWKKSQVKDNCMKSVPFNAAKKNVINAALPCATTDEFNDAMSYVHDQTCQNW